MATRSVFGWFHHRKGEHKRTPKSKQPRNGRRIHSYLPRLEVLEDRSLPSYIFQTIDDPNAGTTGNGIQGTFPVGINAGGQISGNYGDANNVTHGFLLSGGQFTSFDDPNAGTGAGQGTGAFGINALGQIVGEFMDANNVQHGFLLSGGQYTTLDDPNTGTGPFLFDQAVSINAGGQIVGAYTDAEGTTHGYLLSGGQYTNVDDPNGVINFALGINASGQIAGNYTDASSVSHGFLLSHGQYTTFDDPHGVQTLAGGINDSGQIVGTYLDANNIYHAFLLSGGQYTSLDDPNAGTGAFQGTFAFGINDAGKIVGFYYDANNVIHGFLATPVRANAALGASNNLASFSILTSAGGTLNLLVAAADATPPGNLIISAAGTSGAIGGDSQGQGIGGGVYNLGKLSRDVATLIKHNHASTNNDDIFP
jgi:probable HAF family extracellular repeat protein